MIGFTAFFEGRNLGKITGFFHNNAQYVLEIRDTRDEEILIPWVDHYIGKIDSDKEALTLLNMDELLDIQ